MFPRAQTNLAVNLVGVSQIAHPCTRRQRSPIQLNVIHFVRIRHNIHAMLGEGHITD